MYDIAISTTSATPHLHSEISESQSIDITSMNINIHDSRGCDLRPTSKANISTTMVKQNNSLAIDTDTVNISTTNATLNNQVWM